MTPPEYQGHAIIFDCDGVLVDSELIAGGVAAAVLQNHGVSISRDEVLRRFLGRPLTYLIDELSREHDTDLNDGFLPEIRAAELAAMESGVSAIAGMDELLHSLPLPKCVASSSERARLRAALTTSGLIGHFGTHIYSAEQVARPKPFPDLFLHGAAKLGVPAANCIVVEDSKAGLRAAIDGGMTAIGFTGGAHAKSAAFGDGLVEAGASVIAEDVPALAKILATLLPDEFSRIIAVA